MKSFGAAANFGRTRTQFVNRCDGWSGGAPLRFQLEAGGGFHWLLSLALVRSRHCVFLWSMVLVFWVGDKASVSSVRRERSGRVARVVVYTLRKGGGRVSCRNRILVYYFGDLRKGLCSVFCTV